MKWRTTSYGYGWRVRIKLHEVQSSKHYSQHLGNLGLSQKGDPPSTKKCSFGFPLKPPQERAPSTTTPSQNRGPLKWLVSLQMPTRRSTAFHFETPARGISQTRRARPGLPALSASPPPSAPPWASALASPLASARLRAGETRDTLKPSKRVGKAKTRKQTCPMVEIHLDSTKLNSN